MPAFGGDATWPRNVRLGHDCGGMVAYAYLHPFRDELAGQDERDNLPLKGNPAEMPVPYRRGACEKGDIGTCLKRICGKRLAHHSPASGRRQRPFRSQAAATGAEGGSRLLSATLTKGGKTDCRRHKLMRAVALAILTRNGVARAVLAHFADATADCSAGRNLRLPRRGRAGASVARRLHARLGARMLSETGRGFAKIARFFDAGALRRTRIRMDWRSLALAA